MNRREYSTKDRHGVAVMERPPVETFLGYDDDGACPICDGRGFTWEMDMEDPDGGGLPEPCPLAEQTPELHGQPRMTVSLWTDYDEERQESWRVTITNGDRWQITGTVRHLGRGLWPGDVLRDLEAALTTTTERRPR